MKRGDLVRINVAGSSYDGHTAVLEKEICWRVWQVATGNGRKPQFIADHLELIEPSEPEPVGEPS